jgi:hypothetical protein
VNREGVSYVYYSMMMRVVLMAMLLSACGGAIEFPDADADPSAPEITKAGDAGGKVADAAHDTELDACRTTPESQAACWSSTERLLLGGYSFSSVDYSKCPDDGRAFVDDELRHGRPCYRPSNLNPGATVWCCIDER